MAPGIILPRTTPLWTNPQTAPHPAFNYPTMTHPPEDPPSEWWTPTVPVELPATIAGIEPVASTGEDGGVPTGAGIAIFGRLAVVPGFFGPTHVVDIADPTAPVVLSEIDERHRNVDLIAFPDGRLVAVFSTGEGKLPVWDLTDPKQPKALATMEPSTATHKVNVVPGTPIVYNANARGGSTRGFVGEGNLGRGVGQTEIFDLTDPAKLVLVQEWKNGYGCHHIYFWIDAANEKYRAICAGIEVTQIWDVADPRNPTIVSTIPVHHGTTGTPSTAVVPLRFSHFSILNDDGTVLIVGDETGGGALMGCDAHAEAAGRSASGPLGNVYFYDVKDEKNPRLMGWLNPGTHWTTNTPDPSGGPFGLLFGGGCTAHHGRLVPDPEGRDLLAMAFYGAGVVLVDFSDPSNPLIVDQWNDGTNTWEVWYYNGYLYTGDLNRGLDVLKFV